MSKSLKKENKSVAFEKKTLSNGKENPKYIDLLDEDKPISGQKFACVSFLSPEKIIKQRELYMFEKFVEQWDFNKSMDKFLQFLHFVSEKFNVSFDSLTKDYKEFVEEERKTLSEGIYDEFRTFLDQKEEELEKKFNKDHKFQTSIRGLKIRGAFPTQEEAEMRCKLIREMDPNHDVYVGPVGVWMPFHPEAYKTGKVEYMEEELNQLMSEKQKNEAKAKEEFDARVLESKQKAMEENKKLAEKTGNKLTQTINEQGKLVGIKNVVQNLETLLEADSETNKKEMTVQELQQELFEGDNIVTGKTDNGQSLLVSGPFATKKT